MDIIKCNTNIQRIPPFIDQLVDLIHTDEFQEFISCNVTEDIDKQSFMLFVMLYYNIYLNIYKKEKKNVDKNFIKYLMSEFINDKNKREQCISLFLNQNKSIN